MANTGYILPRSASSTSETGWADPGGAWINPQNIYGAGEASITDNAYDAGDNSHVLRGYNFDFSGIPANSTINGVICRIYARASVSNSSISLVQLLDVSGARVGTNMAATPTTVTTSSAPYTFGANNNNWGNSLTLAWLQDADFGVGVGMTNGTNNADVWIDSIELDVYYTPPTQNITLTCEVTNYTVTGQSATLTLNRNYILSAEVTAFTVTPQDVTFTVQRNYVLVAEVTNYTITGLNIVTTATGQVNYLVTKTGYYVTHNNMLITINSDVAGDILMLQEGSGGTYTEIELTSTTTPPTFN